MSEELTHCRALIANHLSLVEADLIAEDFEKLENSLTGVIKKILNQDFQRLLNALYKIDIDEPLFKRILSTSPPDMIANHLAKEVIRREMQKVQTRLKYKNQ